MDNKKDTSFSIGMIRNTKRDIGKKMNMEVIIHEDKSFHYQFSKGNSNSKNIFGTYKTIKFENIRDLAETIKNKCTASDAFVSGFSSYSEIEVLTPTHIQNLDNDAPPYITRTKANFHWSNKPGVLTIDIDSYKGDYISQEDALEGLFKAIPELKDAPILIKPSTSSCIYYTGKAEVKDINNKVLEKDSTGKITLAPKKGLRIYVIISSLNWLNEAKQFMETRLWNAGFGYLDFNANGSDNYRCLVDLSMYNSTDRADYIKASLDKVEGFYQDFEEFEILNENNPPLNIKKFRKINQEEIATTNSLKKAAREDKANVERKAKIREEYALKHENDAIAIESKKRKLSEDDKKEIRSKVRTSINKLYQKKQIDSLHPLLILDKNTGTVRVLTTDEIFKSEESIRYFHGMPCASVLDPFYFPGKTYGNNAKYDPTDSLKDILGTTGMTKSGVQIDFTRAKILSANDTPSIFDQSHGGIRFYFDTEFFDIKRLEIKRLEVKTIDLPKYNLTDIANCFNNQYDSSNDNDIENFGNVLKNLECEIGDLAYKVFHLALGKSEAFSKSSWNDLTGYGPSLGEFFQKSPEKRSEVDLSESKMLEEVNKLDIKHKLNLMNKTFIKVMYPGGKVFYMTKRWDNKFGWSYSDVERKGVVEYYWEHRYYRIANNGNTERGRIADVWFDDASKKKFPGVGFYPIANVVATNDNYIKSKETDNFNLYTGLNLVPKPKLYQYQETNAKGQAISKSKLVKGWHLFDKHIFEIICDGDKTKYNYILGWIANMFQFPDRMGETILAFQSEEGAGKNTVWDPIMNALGTFGVALVDGNQITGTFNEAISGKILVILNEAVWEGDKKGHGALKSIATEPHLAINAKHKNMITIKNTTHLVIMTNHEAVAPMGVGDRRIVTFDVNDKVKRNTTYFAELRKEIYSGGIESFVYDMLRKDLSDFNIRDLPTGTHSDSAIASIMNSAQPWLKWWYECLCDDELYGYIPAGTEKRIDGFIVQNAGAVNGIENTSMLSELLYRWGERMPTSTLYDCFLNWQKDCGIRSSKITQNSLTAYMKNLITKRKNKPNINYVSDDKVCRAASFDIAGDTRTRRCLFTGNIDECRKDLEFKLGRKIDWDD